MKLIIACHRYWFVAKFRPKLLSDFYKMLYERSHQDLLTNVLHRKSRLRKYEREFLFLLKFVSKLLPVISTATAVVDGFQNVNRERVQTQLLV